TVWIADVRGIGESLLRGRQKTPDLGLQRLEAGEILGSLPRRERPREPHPVDEEEVQHGQDDLLRQNPAERGREEIHRRGEHEQPPVQRVRAGAGELPAVAHRDVLPSGLVLMKDLEVTADTFYVEMQREKGLET